MMSALNDEVVLRIWDTVKLATGRDHGYLLVGLTVVEKEGGRQWAAHHLCARIKVNQERTQHVCCVQVDEATFLGCRAGRGWRCARAHEPRALNVTATPQQRLDEVAVGRQCLEVCEGRMRRVRDGHVLGGVTRWGTNIDKAFGE